jgi:hypothetical protein
MIGGSQELNDYILKSEGLTRRGLNIMCLVGLFIFGWLLLVTFDVLNRKKQGWLYILPCLMLLLGSRFGDNPLGLLAAGIYGVGWLHANVILSRYQRGARARLERIGQLPPEQQSADVILEKGLLESKVLGDAGAGGATFSRALSMPGGEAKLFNLAGMAMLSYKRYAEAKQLFDRALADTGDEALIELVTQNLAVVARKLG